MSLLDYIFVSVLYYDALIAVRDTLSAEVVAWRILCQCGCFPDRRNSGGYGIFNFNVVNEDVRCGTVMGNSIELKAYFDVRVVSRRNALPPILAMVDGSSTVLKFSQSENVEVPTDLTPSGSTIFLIPE